MREETQDGKRWKREVSWGHSDHDSFTWTVLSRSRGGGGGWRMGWCEGAQRQASIWPLRHRQGPGDKRGLCSPVVPSSKLSGNSVLQSLSPLRSLSLSPRLAKECGFCKSTHTHTRGVFSPSLVSYYCNDWCKECCAIDFACMQHKHLWHLKFHRKMRTFVLPLCTHTSLMLWTAHSHILVITTPSPRRWCCARSRWDQQWDQKKDGWRISWFLMLTGEFVYSGVFILFSRIEKDANEIMNQWWKKQPDSNNLKLNTEFLNTSSCLLASNQNNEQNGLYQIIPQYLHYLPKLWVNSWWY